MTTDAAQSHAAERREHIHQNLEALAEALADLPDFARISSIYVTGYTVEVLIDWDSFNRLFAQAEYRRNGSAEFLEKAIGRVHWHANRKLPEARREVTLPMEGAANG